MDLANYPFGIHPCWSNDHSSVWERIHLPVAPRCNVKCIFCDRHGGATCHMPVPGRALRVMNVDEALSRLKEELAKRPNLKIVAVSGPGEPLYNQQTFEVMEAATELDYNLDYCLSSNGVFLLDSIPRLSKIGVRTVTVSMSAVRPETAEKVYEWVKFDRERIFEGFGEAVVQRQLDGIREARRHGIHIKVNSVLMPGINLDEMGLIAKEIAKAGAEFHNIMPLVPCGTLNGTRPPTQEELARARQMAAKHLDQFFECKLCRSDVVGVPGHDTIL
ncbi:MAG: radical SAM protein [Candidatus Thorarchaeota archaeon]